MPSGINPTFAGLFPSAGQVAYALLTRAPVAARSVATPALPLDLHVLSLSLAFILSQDQTLRCVELSLLFSPRPKVPFHRSPRHIPDARRCRANGLVHSDTRATLACCLPLLSKISPPFLRGTDREYNLSPPLFQTSGGLSLAVTLTSRKRVQRYILLPFPSKFFDGFFRKKFIAISQIADNKLKHIYLFNMLNKLYYGLPIRRHARTSKKTPRTKTRASP